MAYENGDEAIIKYLMEKEKEKQVQRARKE